MSALPGYALDDPRPGSGERTGTRLLDGAPVAVELLPPAAADAARDASAALRRPDARHLVRVRDVLAGPEGVALVRDRVDGGDVEQERLRAGGTLPPAVAAALVADVLDALGALHAAGVAHGALQETDVRLDGSVPLRPVVRLTGWGTAALLGRPASPPADVRDAGRLLVQLLTGAPDGPVAPEAARALEPVLGPMTADDPAARPPAAWARDALRAAALADLPAQPPVVPVAAAGGGPSALLPPPAAGPALRGPRLPLAGVLLLCLLGFGLLAGATALLLVPRLERLTTDLVTAPLEAVPAQPYAFPTLERADGLLLDRTWVLEEDGAVLRGTTTVTNPTPGTKNAGVDEVVPKSVADDVDDLVFTPGPDAIVQRDPVVRFNVAGLAPGGARTWEFVVRLPPGAGPLEQLAQDAERARLEYEAERRRLLEQLRATPTPR